MDEVTYNEHGVAMQFIIKELQKEFSGEKTEENGMILRDLALANTHLEDALTRYNSAQYRIAGVWQRNDPDKPTKRNSPTGE